jgi:hypothetical protein
MKIFQNKYGQLVIFKLYTSYMVNSMTSLFALKGMEIFAHEFKPASYFCDHEVSKITKI